MKWILFSLLTTCLFGCAQRDKPEAQAFYTRMNQLIDRAEVPLDALADSVISIHQQLKLDNDFSVDTTEIDRLLQQSISLNQNALDSLQQMEDPASDIGLKETAVIYLNDWKDLLYSEFKEWRQLLSVPMEDKAGYLSVMFTDPLNESSRLSSNLQKKSVLFKKKFEF